MNTKIDAEHNIPTILVVFGATGDLMARKLAPALLKLYERNLCPDKFAVVGFARRDLGDEGFRAHVDKTLRAYPAKPGTYDKFQQILNYLRGDFNEADAYKKLSQKLKSIDDQWGVCTNKLFYLAVPPENYESIFTNLAKSGLTEPCGGDDGWTRVLVEKPFGKDLDQAIKLDKLLGTLFEEEQIYRIDHYLAKEAIQNILAFRFANNFLEASWDSSGIEKIEIKLLEAIDIEGRGGFYDSVGALLDVGQNHLLQMLALVTMDNPIDLTSDHIRDKRAEIIESIEPIKDPLANTSRAQYAGYTSEDNVDSNSVTETYFKIQTSLKHPSWQGVPIILEAGKKLPKADKQIIITYRHPSPCLCPGDVHYKNQLYVHIQPDPGIAIRFWSRKPGTKDELEEQWLKFDYPLGETARYTEEYTQLLLDAIAGDQTLFVSSRETMASWRFIDPIERSWRASAENLLRYSSDKPLPDVQPEHSTLDIKKEIGVVGLGKMGYNLGLRLSEKGWKVLGFDTKPPTQNQLLTVASYQELVRKLRGPRLIWLMVPSTVVDDALFGKDGLSDILEPGDIIIDGGNSHYKESQKRAKKLATSGIEFIDVGVSGGPNGARTGASLMIGGKQELFEQWEPLFADLSVENGYKFFAGSGAGHFVKMIHNGIEYGMMQAIAEGFTVLKTAKFDLKLVDIASIYNHGSVIESRLIAWLEQAFRVHGEGLDTVSGSVGHTGEGEWTIGAAKQFGIKAKFIEEALNFRKASESNPSYTGQILSAMREQFGGHTVKVSKK
ncbi:hypothetical protein COU91_03115 [Candidatus Saccharibacteria bacterium CG10_big_fil_rev_8_21_14_0_10_47_8]|nr:MAG: hypothetical protein COU91_03115 [Candidatus Saccharibacteria bacterium CG10_big_fil_rev_8_21_14_0_10_47_8]